MAGTTLPGAAGCRLELFSIGTQRATCGNTACATRGGALPAVRMDVPDTGFLPAMRKT